MNTTKQTVIHPLKGETLYKIKGYRDFHIVFNYDEEVFYIFHDGTEIASCLTASDAKAIVKEVGQKLIQNFSNSAF